VYQDVHPTLADGKYDTEFPNSGCAEQLEEISESVKMVSCIAYYRQYRIPPGQHVVRKDVNEIFLEKRRNEAVFTNSTTSGTATVISYGARRVALITCAHVVGFPDTVFSYEIGPDRKLTPFVRSIAIKERQTVFVAVFPEGGELEILAMDNTRDIALLGRRFETEPTFRIPVFNYPIGRARELEWGTFLYLFGYPSGYKMLTTGIVSSPGRDKSGGFVVDAVFGRGSSGGIALAIRDGVPNFEFVGMLKLVSAHMFNLLVPQSDDTYLEYDATVPYGGDIFVQKEVEIDYGITQAISAESIGEFLDQNRAALHEKGYDISLRTRQE
jgi:hypothetical protein